MGKDGAVTARDLSACKNNLTDSRVRDGPISYQAPVRVAAPGAGCES